MSKSRVRATRTQEQKPWAIVYLRPDGWWEAGRGWRTREAAWTDAKEQLPGVKWRVVRITELPEILCEEALETP